MDQEQEEIKAETEAIMPEFEKKEQKEKEPAVHQKNFLRAFVLFIMAYAFLYFFVIVSPGLHNVLSQLSAAMTALFPPFIIITGLINMILPFAQWTSPTFFLLPIAGYFLMYYGLEWIEKNFELGEMGKTLVPFIFWFVAIIAFDIVLLVYYYNSYILFMGANQQFAAAGLDYLTWLNGGTFTVNGATQTFAGLGFNPWELLKNDAFFVFCWGATLGWAARKFVLKVVEGKTQTTL